MTDAQTPPASQGATPAPSRTRQRTPSIFAPSAHQLKRLRELLGTDEAVRQTLRAIADYGLPIGPQKPTPAPASTTRDARALHRTLQQLAELAHPDNPAFQALLDQAAADGSDSPVAPLLRALDSNALPLLIARTAALSAPTPGRPGRPADTEKAQRMQLIETLANIAENQGLRVARLSPDFYELIDIAADLAYITGISTDTAVRDLLLARRTRATKGRRIFRNLI